MPTTFTTISEPTIKAETTFMKDEARGLTFQYRSTTKSAGTHDVRLISIDESLTKSAKPPPKIFLEKACAKAISSEISIVKLATLK